MNIRLAWACWRAWVRAKKEGLQMNSKTKWGAVIAGAATIIGIVGTAIQSGTPIAWGELLPQIVTVIGLVVAAIGARDAVSKIGKPLLQLSLDRGIPNGEPVGNRFPAGPQRG